jgi:hypothetical protein
MTPGAEQLPKSSPRHRWIQGEEATECEEATIELDERDVGIRHRASCGDLGQPSCEGCPVQGAQGQGGPNAILEGITPPPKDGKQLTDDTGVTRRSARDAHDAVLC